MPKTEEYLKNIAEDIAKEKNIEEWEVTQLKFETVAENFFGILIPVVLNGRRNGCDVSLNMVLKLAPEASDAVAMFFEREVLVYNTVLKKYKELQQDFSNSSKFVIPECYFVRKDFGKEAIALENMCIAGYKPYLDQSFLDVDHMAASLTSLAKMHALSFILKKRDEDLYSEIKAKLFPLKFESVLEVNLLKAIEKFEGTEYISVLKDLSENCDKYLGAPYMDVKQNVICHGDIWKENVLFKYKEEKPISACLIDYQTSRMRSPAYDIIYLFVTSTNSELRSNTYHHLINLYHEAFEKVLSEADIQAKDVYTRDDLEHDLRASAPSCLIVANTGLWISNGLQEAGGLVKSKKVLTTAEEKLRGLENYKNDIKAIIDDFKSFGYL